jgi:hypothetical protein
VHAITMAGNNTLKALAYKPRGKRPHHKASKQAKQATEEASDVTVDVPISDATGERNHQNNERNEVHGDAMKREGFDVGAG